MENGVNKMEFLQESLFVDVMDQYIVWRLNNLLEVEEDPRVRRACRELIVFMSTPETPDD
jgi:hypothetical protein